MTYPITQKAFIEALHQLNSALITLEPNQQIIQCVDLPFPFDYYIRLYQEKKSSPPLTIKEYLDFVNPGTGHGMVWKKQNEISAEKYEKTILHTSKDVVLKILLSKDPSFGLVVNVKIIDKSSAILINKGRTYNIDYLTGKYLSQECLSNARSSDQKMKKNYFHFEQLYWDSGGVEIAYILWEMIEKIIQNPSIYLHCT